MPQAALAEREVLTIGAASLAVAKEDRARAACAANGRLFAPMHIPRGNNCLCAGMADARFPGDAVAAAILGTDSTTAQDFPRFGGANC